MDGIFLLRVVRAERKRRRQQSVSSRFPVGWSDEVLDATYSPRGAWILGYVSVREGSGINGPVSVGETFLDGGPIAKEGADSYLLPQNDTFPMQSTIFINGTERCVPAGRQRATAKRGAGSRELIPAPQVAYIAYRTMQAAVLYYPSDNSPP